ncbi:Glutamate/Leucine/Phenylalanine/Valine dehydrogenase [Popillia japonica]|uniref:Glutamate/Leucine/Phenylalanine/Valine dehydrogenase n=1 Tax=Popillia japonica TaxID=7064 RepID=A0AAW1K317_POPJA
MEYMKSLGLGTGWKDKTFILQGFGKVGTHTMRFLTRMVAKCIGISGIDATIVNPTGNRFLGLDLGEQIYRKILRRQEFPSSIVVGEDCAVNEGQNPPVSDVPDADNCIWSAADLQLGQDQLQETGSTSEQNAANDCGGPLAGSQSTDW